VYISAAGGGGWSLSQLKDGDSAPASW